MDSVRSETTTPKRRSAVSRRQALRVAAAALAAGVAAPLLSRTAAAASLVDGQVDARSWPGQGPARVQQTGSTVSITYWGSFASNLGEAEQAMVKRFNESQSDVQ